MEQLARSSSREQAECFSRVLTRWRGPEQEHLLLLAGSTDAARAGYGGAHVLAQLHTGGGTEGGMVEAAKTLLASEADVHDGGRGGAEVFAQLPMGEGVEPGFAEVINGAMADPGEATMDEAATALLDTGADGPGDAALGGGAEQPRRCLLR